MRQRPAHNTQLTPRALAHSPAVNSYVRLLTAANLRKVTKSAMDPTVQVQLGPGGTAEATKRTAAAVDADRTPSWNETLTLEYGPEIILASGRTARTPTILVRRCGVLPCCRAADAAPSHVHCVSLWGGVCVAPQFTVETSGKLIGESVIALAALAQHPGEVLDVSRRACRLPPRRRA